jgi:hypothetical protein
MGEYRRRTGRMGAAAATRARVRTRRELRGVIWIWMGGNASGSDGTGEGGNGAHYIACIEYLAYVTIAHARHRGVTQLLLPYSCLCLCLCLCSCSCSCSHSHSCSHNSCSHPSFMPSPDVPPCARQTMVFTGGHPAQARRRRVRQRRHVEGHRRRVRPIQVQ